MQVDLISFAEHAVAVLAASVAAIQTWRERKARVGKHKAEASQRVAEDQSKLLAGKEQIIDMGQQQHEMLKAQITMMKEQLSDWEKRYTTEHMEFTNYRAARHAADNDTQGLLLRYSAELAELRAKTDLTPVVEAQKEQTKINGRILDGLVQVATTTSLLNQRLESFCSHVGFPAFHPINQEVEA